MGSARLAVVASILLAAGPAWATNGMRMIGFGPVQTSMGGVGVGATLDACTVLSNPAGLAELDRRVDLGLSWFKPTVGYQASESQLPPGFQGAVVAQPGQTFDSARGGSPIPALGMVVPLSGGFTAGLGLFGVSGMGVDQAANLYGGTTVSSYLQARLTPAVAYRFNESWSAGLTVNAMAAQMRWNVAAGFGQQPHDTATALGIGATLGLKYRPVEAVSIGLAYETRSRFQDFTFDIPAHGGVNPQTFQPVSFPGGKDRLSFDQPSSATLGVAVTAAEWLLLAADFQWIRWSEIGGSSQPAFQNDTSATGAMPWNLDWKDQWVVKLGTQVAATRSLSVRAGWNYGKMPLDASRAFENIAFPAVAEHHLTAGAGYALSPRLTANLGFMYAPQARIEGANAALPPQGGQAIASYQAKMSQYAIDAGVAYRF